MEEEWMIGIGLKKRKMRKTIQKKTHSVPNNF